MREAKVVRDQLECLIFALKQDMRTKLRKEVKQAASRGRDTMAQYSQTPARGPCRRLPSLKAPKQARDNCIISLT